MAPAPHLRISPQEYLAHERSAEVRSEFVDGYIYAMPGASIKHNTIAANLAGEMVIALKGKACTTLTSDTKVRTPNAGLYCYPDLTIVCGKLEIEDEHQDVLLNPTMIFEVLSPSTEAWDRGKKFARYQSIPSLREYILVSQDIPRIEQFARDGENWRMTIAEGLEASLTLQSSQVILKLHDVYARVEFDPDASPRPI